MIIGAFSVSRAAKYPKEKLKALIKATLTNKTASFRFSINQNFIFKNIARI